MYSNFTVREYIYSICRNRNENDKVKRLINIIDKKNNKRYPIYNKYFMNLIPLSLRLYFNKRIKIDFNLPCLLSNHFILRLLSRFKDENISIIMNDINRILNNRSNIGLSNNSNSIIELYGLFYSIVYSNINNILLTIIPYSIIHTDDRYLYKCSVSTIKQIKSRKNNGYNKKKINKRSNSLYNKIIRSRQSRNIYL